MHPRSQNWAATPGPSGTLQVPLSTEKGCFAERLCLPLEWVGIHKIGEKPNGSKGFGE